MRGARDGHAVTLSRAQYLAGTVKANLAQQLQGGDPQSLTDDRLKLPDAQADPTRHVRDSDPGMMVDAQPLAQCIKMPSTDTDWPKVRRARRKDEGRQQLVLDGPEKLIEHRLRGQRGQRGC